MSLTKADLAHLRRALRIAKTSTCRQKHGAIVANGKRVHSVGVNSFRSHPNVVSDPKADASWHAEVAAIRGMRGIPTGMTLYVARVGKAGLPVLSKPCPRCMSFMIANGISRVVYTADGGGYGVIQLA